MQVRVFTVLAVLSLTALLAGCRSNKQQPAMAMMRQTSSYPEMDDLVTALNDAYAAAVAVPNGTAPNDPAPFAGDVATAIRAQRILVDAWIAEHE